MICRDGKVHYTTNSLFFFFSFCFFCFFFFFCFLFCFFVFLFCFVLFFTITRSGCLAEIRLSICISKSRRILCVLFSRTDSRLCTFYLFIWSILNFLHNSQWIIFPTQSCLVLNSFCASLLHWLIKRLIVTSLYHITYICYFLASLLFLL